MGGGGRAETRETWKSTASKRGVPEGYPGERAPAAHCAPSVEVPSSVSHVDASAKMRPAVPARRPRVRRRDGVRIRRGGVAGEPERPRARPVPPRFRVTCQPHRTWAWRPAVWRVFHAWFMVSGRLLWLFNNYRQFQLDAAAGTLEATQVTHAAAGRHSCW